VSEHDEVVTELVLVDIQLQPNFILFLLEALLQDVVPKSVRPPRWRPAKPKELLISEHT
jgi:hypothetical protein